MVLGPKLLDLLDQFLFRVLDMNLVNALGGLYSCCAPLAWLLAITLQNSQPKTVARALVLAYMNQLGECDNKY